MSKQTLKRIKMEWKHLTEDEKDAILKTLLVSVVGKMPPEEEFPILKAYANYGGQAFDQIIEIEEDQHTIYFKNKIKT